MAQEKRKSQRVKEDFSILCKIFRKTELEGTVSKIIDISKSGVAFFTNNPLSKNDLLQMTFRTPPDFKEKIELFGRVIDSQKVTETNFKTRVTFIDIGANAKTILNSFIEQAALRK